MLTVHIFNAGTSFSMIRSFAILLLLIMRQCCHAEERNVDTFIGNRTRSSASAVCKKLGLWLPGSNSLSQFNSMKDIMRKTNVDEIWTSLKKIKHNEWLPSDHVLTNKTPPEVKEKGNCMTLEVSKKSFRQVACIGTQEHFLCIKTDCARCPYWNCVKFNKNSSCLKMFSGKVSWYQADAECRASGGHLWSPSKEDKKQVDFKAPPWRKVKEAWTGWHIQEWQVENTNGSTHLVDDFRFSASETDDVRSCASLKAPGMTWNTRPCTESLPTICIKFKNQPDNRGRPRTGLRPELTYGIFGGVAFSTLIIGLALGYICRLKICRRCDRRSNHKETGVVGNNITKDMKDQKLLRQSEVYYEVADDIPSKTSETSDKPFITTTPLPCPPGSQPKYLALDADLHNNEDISKATKRTPTDGDYDVAWDLKPSPFPCT